MFCSDALSKYQSETGAVSDQATGLLRVTSAQYSNLKSLFYKIGDVRLLCNLTLLSLQRV